MSPRVASAASARRASSRTTRSAGARRARAGVRRRRVLLALVALVVLGVAAVTIVPRLDDAVNEITLPLRHDDIIRQQAHDKGLDPSLIAAVIYAESKFRDQTSSAGARGLMQVTPETADFIARKSGATTFTTKDLGTPQVNIAYGSWYLRYLLDRYDGNTALAVAAYNAGEGNVDRWLAEERISRRDFRAADVPFPETRAYVTRVLDSRDRYRDSYASELGL